MVEVDMHELSYLVYYSAGKTDTCSQLKVFFSFSKRKGLLQYIVENEVSVLATLAFYENVLIGQETTVRIKGVEFRKNVRAFPAGTNKTVRNNEVQAVSNR